MTFARRAATLLALAPLALAALVTFHSDASAQGFRAVYTRDGIDAIAVGDNGDTYRTLVGGDSWTEQPLGLSSDVLNDVQGRGYTLLVVSGGGLIWRSTDSGGNWISTSASGNPSLKAIAMPADSVWYVVGSLGTVLKTVDAGATWNALSTGTGQTLYGVCFTDANHGWAAGDHGTLLGTTDGGATWNPVALATINPLYSVDQRGSKIWVVGANATAFRSTDGGATFGVVNLKFDAHADVKVVRMTGADSLYLAGGGGFIRYTTNGGATWTFQQHRMHAPITDIAVNGSVVFASDAGNRVVMYSTNGGAFWRFPSIAGFTRSWGANPKYVFGGQVRGTSFGLNPVYKSTIYCGIGPNVMRSRDDGDTWQVAAALPSGYSKVNAFIVSAKDSNVWLAAIAGASVVDRVYRTADGGTTWTISLTHDFGEYGIPMRNDPDHPDTVYFGGELSASGSPLTPLQRSTDFGLSWNNLGPSVFRSPCDLVIQPDSSNVIVVADGVTGSGSGHHLKSTDYGQTWQTKDTTPGSEIPGMANSRLSPSTILSTNWPSGGTMRTQNGGETWQFVDSSPQTWGIDVAKDDPNVYMFGQYSGNPVFTYLSLDGGATFSSISVPNTFGNNYSFYLRDRGTILAEQSSGIWKLSTTYTITPASNAQSLTLSAPDGGEVWQAGTYHVVTWAASNIALVRLEYRRALGQPWVWIADVPGYNGSYGWTVPYDATAQAKVRVYDIADASPMDSSSALFTISAPMLDESPASLAFGTQPYQTSSVLPLTIRNAGNLTLHVTSISTQTGVFAPGRTTLTLAPSQQDTVGVWFMPPWGGVYADTATIVCDDLGHSPLRVPLGGTATGPQVHLTSPIGGESWAYGSQHAVTWTSDQITNVKVEYRVHPDSAWVTVTPSTDAAAGSYLWTVPYHPTVTAAVRVSSTDGAPSDASPAVFALTSSALAATPAPVDFGVVEVGNTIGTAIAVSNPGNAPLNVSAVSVDKPEFWVSRTSFVVPAGTSDTLGVFFHPTGVGPDSAMVSFVSDAPGSPQELKVGGMGVNDVAVTGAQPARFSLAQNQPNPFGRSTLIRYTLAHDADVALDVYDLGGKRVATLASGRQGAGVYRVSFARAARGAGTLPAGVYFYRLQAGGFLATRKMLIVR